MFLHPSRNLVRTALLAVAGLPALFTPADAAAQCQVLSAPAAFDPPASGIPSPLRPTNDSMGISGSSRRLLVRYNYGFVTYNLASPSSPQLISAQSLLSMGYPKSGDGQTRTGKVALSADGQRTLVPWTDTVGYGTIALGSSGSGDYLPEGYNANYSAAVKVGGRYLGFTASTVGVYAADLTTLPGTGASVKNGIPSERMTALGTDLQGMIGVESPARQWVVGSSQTRVVVLDVSNPGAAVPGLTNGFTWTEYSATQLGVPSGSYINNVAAVAHPSDGALHFLVEGARYIRPYTYATSVALYRVDPSTSALTVVASFTPAAGENLAQKGIVLLAFDTDVFAFLPHRLATGGMKLQVRSSLDFGTNLAGSAPTITTPGSIGGMVGFRSTGGNVHLYMGDGGYAYAMSLDCSATPSPAAAFLAVERVPTSGTPTIVPDGGPVFIGDELRVKPSYSPPDFITPLIDWRLDYDFHDGNAADSRAAAMRLVNADASRSLGPQLPPAELTLVGPCDPAQVPQGGPTPSPLTGDGCWTSVTTNGAFGIPPGTPDFSGSAPTDRELTIGFEVQNGLSAGGSSVAKHRISWRVPQQLLKNASILSGGALEDASEGSPATTGLRWYFARVPVGEAGADALLLEPGCTGPTCAPTSFTQPGQTSPGLQRPGSYRYWASVPYRGGFRTTECPGLAGAACAGDAAKTVAVTAVVLSLTAPVSTVVGAPSVHVSSTSKKAASVTPCLTPTGFSYDVCEVSGENCPAGAFTGAGLTVSNPFPATGSGTISIPTPPAGDRGLRIRYSYTTTGDCGSPNVAQWPADGGFSPLLVAVATPTVRLRNLANTADISSFQGTWGLTTGELARAYAYVDGVEDPSPPATISWSYTPAGGASPTPIGVQQGQVFSMSTPGDYVFTLDGYGVPATASVIVDPPVGGVGDPPVVTEVAFSKAWPAVGESVTITCQASPGTDAIGTYLFSFGDGESGGGPSPSVDHAWATEGTKTVTCTAYDAKWLASAPLSALVDVGGVGPTYPLYVNQVGAGSGLVSSTPSGLSCGLVCSATFPSGDTVILEALPSAGARFAGWSGAGCQGTNPCAVAMTDVRRVTAAFLPQSGASLTALSPCRVADTRAGSGVPLAAGEVREFGVVASGCNVPSGAVAAALNVTVTAPSGQGSVVVFPAGAETPGTLTVSFAPGRTRAAPAIVLLGTGGGVRVHNASTGTVHVILDVSGVFQ